MVIITEEITIEAPAGDDPVAAQTAYAVRDALARLGVGGDRLRIVVREVEEA